MNFESLELDPLTQLPTGNRAWPALRKLSEEMTSTQKPWGLITINPDHLRKANDALGLRAGDRLLARVADDLRQRIENSEIAATEEFPKQRTTITPG
jgi:diguanylate cyclase (GGDEF)-like protein